MGLYVSMGNCLVRRSKVDNSLSSRAISGNVSGPCSCRFYYMQLDDHFMFSVLFLLPVLLFNLVFWECRAKWLSLQPLIGLTSGVSLSGLLGFAVFRFGYLFLSLWNLFLRSSFMAESWQTLKL